MGDREERSGLCGQHGLLLAEVLNLDGKDWAIGRRCVAEPFEIGLTERSFPRETLASNRPGAMTAVFALGNVWQILGDQNHVVKCRHPRTVLPQ